MSRPSRWAQVMDGPGGGRRWGGGDGDKHFLLLEPCQAGGGTGGWDDAFMEGLAAGGGVRGRGRKAETQGRGGGDTKAERQRPPGTEWGEGRRESESKT